jgi:membrane-bound lytic murein transglycosylase B
MAARGAVVEFSGAAPSGTLALIELQNGDAPPEYVAGTDNFYAITRYNWSSYYAMAVIALGQAVADAVAAQDRNPPPEVAPSEAGMPK